MPEFLSGKLISLHQRADYLNSLQLELGDLERTGHISAAESRETRDKVERVKLSLTAEALAISQHKNIIIEDMSDNLEYSPYPNVDDAYSITIKQVTDSATGKQEKSKFDRSEFKRRVVEFYGVSRKVVGGKEIFCHLLGWSTYGEVRAARLVPKSLSDDSLVHLFGRELEPRTDPRNGMLQT